MNQEHWEYKFIFSRRIKSKESAIKNNSEECIVILEGNFNKGGSEMPEFKEYSKRSNANGEAHGGVVLQKFSISENLGQGLKPDFVLMVEYPSYEKARDTFTSEEYQSIIPLRDKVFQEVKILLTK